MQTNNKLREALETLVDVVETWQDHFPSAIRDGEVSAALDKAEAALAEPVKNCEVGTAQEQAERFSAYCRAHKHPESECLLCPLFGQTGGHCELVWAQMPYDEEGGAK